MVKSRTVSPFRSGISLTCFFVALTPLLVLAGCGVSKGTAPVPPPTVTISAQPTSIAAGDSAMLTIAAANAQTVTVTGSDGSSYSLASSGGTQKVTPSSTTTYTATAVGVSGKATANVAVTVGAAVAPTITITANPTSVASGAASTLTVTATNASTVTISGSDGTSYNLTSTGGTQKVTPTQTTIYTATATASNGVTAKANVMITVSGTSAAPTVSIVANPTSIAQGNSSVLTVTATNATTVTISGSDSTSYNLQPSGGTQSVSPSATATYTVTATGPGGTISATATVTVVAPGSIKSIDHVIFMLQENRSFDSYFGMLNSYRKANGWTQGGDGKTYAVDGIQDATGAIRPFKNTNDLNQTFSLFKFTSSCIDDLSSAWLESYGDVNRYDFSTTRPIAMDGFVHIAEGFATSCKVSGACSGTFSDTAGKRAMGYYDQDFLNYYYYMASQFAVSDRWFSPVSSKSISNRIATFSGGTTQGLVKDPGNDDKLPQLAIATIFQELDQAKVSWKVYYTVDQSMCTDLTECSKPGSRFPATDFGSFQYSYQFMYDNPTGAPCTPPTQPSSVVGDSSNSFCIDPNHIAPLSQYFKDVANGTLPSFAFIEAGYGNNDEHPGSGQPILAGQAQVASIVNALMQSPSWKDSVFFLSYDEGGGPFDHVPPVPKDSNLNTDPAVVGVPLTSIPDISTIAVNPDTYKPCLPPTGTTATTHCDLSADEPGAKATDAAAVSGFAAQLGFRVPNMVISPWTRAHYVSHIPMDHTAIIKFVENRFIGPSAHLTSRDAAQPNLLDFFDFTGVPWATPPSPPTPAAVGTTCQPDNMGP